MLSEALGDEPGGEQVRVGSGNDWPDFPVGLALTGQILYGEFDSGSERTLAAWIRHASRTLTSL